MIKRVRYKIQGDDLTLEGVRDFVLAVIAEGTPKESRINIDEGVLFVTDTVVFDAGSIKDVKKP